MARKEHARESKNYYTIRSSNLTTRSISLINFINFLPIDVIFSLHAFPPPEYYTGGGNACKENIKSIGRNLMELWNLKGVSVREAFCKTAVEKLSELEETFDGTVDERWNIAA